MAAFPRSIMCFITAVEFAFSVKRGNNLMIDVGSSDKVVEMHHPHGKMPMAEFSANKLYFS